jgi:hypothetical protein
MMFTRQNLEKAGFTGWLPFTDIRASSCPTAGGVYVVTYKAEGPVSFAPLSCGGWFKGKDPTVTLDVLSANWVDGAEVVYIGKAALLRRRLIQYADFGAGRSVGHWGGRLVWQLSSPDQLIVGWKETPACVPAEVEANLIASFRRIYGKPPFANSPQRLGD